MLWKGADGLHGLMIIGVALTGALGALARYGVGRVFRGVSGDFPWGTFAANMVGCIAISAAGAIALRDTPLAPLLRIEVMTGFIGAFTTFSTFQLETVTLAQTAPGRAAVYLLGSTAAGLVAVWLGVILMGGVH